MPAAVAPPPTKAVSAIPTCNPALVNCHAQAAPTIPAPAITTSKVDEAGCVNRSSPSGSSPDPPAQWIPLVEDQPRFGRDERRASNEWPELPFPFFNVAREDTPGDASLPPEFARFEQPVRPEASHLRAGAGSARRPVVRFAGAQHEIRSVGVCDRGRTAI